MLQEHAWSRCKNCNDWSEQTVEGKWEFIYHISLRLPEHGTNQIGCISEEWKLHLAGDRG